MGSPRSVNCWMSGPSFSVFETRKKSVGSGFPTDFLCLRSWFFPGRSPAAVKAQQQEKGKHRDQPGLRHGKAGQAAQHDQEQQHLAHPVFHPFTFLRPGSGPTGRRGDGQRRSRSCRTSKDSHRICRKQVLFTDAGSASVYHTRRQNARRHPSIF